MAVVGVNDQWWVNWQGPWVLLSKIDLKLGYRVFRSFMATQKWNISVLWRKNNIMNSGTCINNNLSTAAAKRKTNQPALKLYYHEFSVR